LLRMSSWFGWTTAMMTIAPITTIQSLNCDMPLIPWTIPLLVINASIFCRSGLLSKNIVPLIHGVFLLHNIFIFWRIKHRMKNRLSIDPKSKVFYRNLTDLWSSWTSSTITWTKFSTNELHDHSCWFLQEELRRIKFIVSVHTQILKEILWTIKFGQSHVKDFINHHREQFTGTDGELNYVKVWETEYHDETPISWYTYKHFLYPMVNRALRLMDEDIIIKMNFFIDHLHRHIERFHWEQFSN
jgi:hypothetical protein